MSSSKAPKNVGCWSGLRALVNTRNRGMGQSSNAPNNPICPDSATKPATVVGDSPPAYQTPSPATSGDFYCTWPALKRENVVCTPTKNNYSFPLPEAATASDQAIQDSDKLLRELSLKIHDRPELHWDVHYAHDILTQFLEEQGFDVTRHYLADQLPGNTAWRGEFTVPSQTKDPLCVIGLNSEMDALPGIGHACGHNLIAIAGVAAALGLKSAMEQHGIPGKVVILGTPSEEGGMGKEWLIRAGAYKEMDICLMAHPSPGDPRVVESPRSLALQSFMVEYHGQTAHAGATPWEGRNALDAVFIAYTALSALRQQVHPSSRIHGVIEGRDWAPNVIPDYAKMKYMVRCPTWEETVALRSRVNRCFEAAAHATSCTMTITEEDAVKDLRQNTVLADEFAAVMSIRHGYTPVPGSEMGASTDFGNVTFELPSIHPTFSIPTVDNGGNHTPAFTAAARTPEAHENTIAVSKGLATVGLRALLDKGFLQSVKGAYKWQ